ncbi:hypothetical protein IW150_002277 [Coemansia sp. RSA 2607]|nr:hypothetical protein IW150_002277 [Coemansia sp. RSA 2607]
MPVHSPLPAVDIPPLDVTTYYFERARAAERDPSAPLVIDGATSAATTLHEIQHHAAALACVLRGLPPSEIPDHPALRIGPVVAILCPAHIHLSAIHFATLMADGTTALLDPALQPDALAERLVATCARAVFVAADLLPTLCSALQMAASDDAAGRSVPGRDMIFTVDRRCPGFRMLDDLLKDNVNAEYCAPQRMSHDQLATTVALIVYSSGTTGAAKGVMLTHRNIVYAQLMVSGYVASESKKHAAPPPTILSALPPHHLYGFSVHVYQPLATATRLVFLRDSSPSAYLQAIDKHKVSRLCATPYTLQMLYENSTRNPHTSLIAIDTPDRQQHFDVSSVRVIVCGGASIPPSMLLKYKEYFNNQALLAIGYGSTEAASIIAGCTFARPPVGAVGVLYPGTSAKVLDNAGKETEGFGSLYVRGPQVMPGYLAANSVPSPVDTDGYLCTGDYARVTPDGAVYLRGRAADVIYTPQGALPAVDVEELVGEHPAVTDCAVVSAGPKDNAWPVIHVVIDPSTSASVEDIDSWLTSRVAYKYELKTVSRIPKNHGGKILRSLLQ